MLKTTNRQNYLGIFTYPFNIMCYICIGQKLNVKNRTVCMNA